MADLKAYFAAPRTAGLPSADEAEALVGACPWFIPGRILLGMVTGEEDPRAALMAPWRAESSLRMPAVDVSALDGSRPTRSSTVFCRRTTCASSPGGGTRRGGAD